MRNEFSGAIEKYAAQDEKILFLTGDLGYKALENLQTSMGPRFINTGVAEQNMVGMAAGLAYKGFKVFCYSIAPFIVYRCLEQFRNDVCLHNLPVFLVGNGGGYGYGIMGSTHHAIEDMACLSSLQNVTCWVPGFSDEVEGAIQGILSQNGPAYLRLGAGKISPADVEQLGSIKWILKSEEPIASVVALGPIANNVVAAIEKANLQGKVNVFTAFQLPLNPTARFYELVGQAPHLVVAEEHVSIGGLAQQLSVKLLAQNLRFNQFISLTAQGYPDGVYGSQAFHQRQSGLSTEQIADILSRF
ncbi:MAG: transketolase [Spirosomataceae bacterium]